MYRMLLGTGLLLCGLFQQEAILGAQEPAFISGDVAVRFEQAPGFYHYAALCRTPTEFIAAMPRTRLPRESTEKGVCWYVMGAKMRNDGGKVDGSPMVDGKLVISEHHIRFIPHDPQLADLYVDFKPEETELLHHPGQMFAALGTTKILIGFRFSKVCPTCAPGTPIPDGTNPALVDQEFQMVLDGIKHFDTEYHHVWALSSKVRVEVRAQNQPDGKDVPEAMRLYSDLNRQLAEDCPEPAKACIRSYAVYQACIADHGGAKCGAEPNCSAACPVTVSQVENLKARACVQLDQPGASLIPDWTDVVRRKNGGNLPVQPLPTGVLDVQLTSGSNPPPGLGCSVEAAYLRASNPGVEAAGAAGSARAFAAAKANVAGAMQPNTVPQSKPSAPPAVRQTTAAATKTSAVPTAKPSTVAAAKPSSSPAAKATPAAAEMPNTVSSAKPSPAPSSTVATAKPPAAPAAKPAPVAAEKPSTVASAKPTPAPSSTVATAQPPAAPAAKPAPVSTNSSSTVASAKASTATPNTVAVARPNAAVAARLASASADRSGTTASAKPNPDSVAKPSAVAPEKLGVTPPARTDVPVKPSISESKPSSMTPAAVKPAVSSGKSNAFVEAQTAPSEALTQKPANTLKIASGTAEGMLVKKVPPTYPLEAKVARVQGTVELNVTISKTGAVTAVDVVSGPEVLQSAAADAVRQWQFRPFSLLGEPVEFETTVHVVFGTGGPPARAQAQGHPSPN